MILNPLRNELKVYYDNKIINLIGSKEQCIEWVIKFTSEEINYASSKELYDKYVYKYNGKYYKQLVVPNLDVVGVGIIYADVFNEICFKYEKVECKRIKL